MNTVQKMALPGYPGFHTVTDTSSAESWINAESPSPWYWLQTPSSLTHSLTPSTLVGHDVDSLPNFPTLKMPVKDIVPINVLRWYCLPTCTHFIPPIVQSPSGIDQCVICSNITGLRHNISAGPLKWRRHFKGPADIIGATYFAHPICMKGLLMKIRWLELSYWNFGWATRFFILTAKVTTGHPKLISNNATWVMFRCHKCFVMLGNIM